MVAANDTTTIALMRIALSCVCLLCLSDKLLAIDISGKTISEPVNTTYWKCNFREYLETWDNVQVNFGGPVRCNNTKFTSTVSFVLADFNDSALFEFADFDSATSFNLARFRSDARFRQATFPSAVDFELVKFDSSVSFMNSRFRTKADFRYAQFAGAVDFYRTLLPDTLDFRNVTTTRAIIDLTTCIPPDSGKSNRKCLIALAGADLSRIRLNMASFRLFFPDESIEDYGSWAEKPLGQARSVPVSLDTRYSVYELLLRNLWDDGLTDSYKILDIEYRHLKNVEGGFFDRFVVDPFQKVWWNYGYGKGYVFLWTLSLWFLFSLINLKYYPVLRQFVYTIPFLISIQEDEGRKVAKKWFYFLQVVTYTAIVFFGLKMDIDKFGRGSVRSYPWLFAYLMFIYAAGLVCLGFMVNIIFTK